MAVKIIKPRMGLYHGRKKRRALRNTTVQHGSFYNTLMDYLNNTSVHGLHYLMEEGRHPVERVLWGALCLMSVGGCYYMSKIVLDRFLTSPTMTVVESTGYPVANIPFPAITLCPVNRVDWARLVDYQKQYLANNTPEEINAFFKLMAAMSMIAFGDYDKIQDSFKNDFSVLSALPHMNMTEVMHMVRPRCEEVFSELCWWRNKNFNCCDLFEPQRSETGLCFSFNSETSDERHDSAVLRPRHTSDSGQWSGLRVNVYMDLKKLPPLAADKITPSVMLLVDNPLAFPTFGIVIPVEQFAQVSIVATDTYSTDSVRSLKIERRKCIYPEEQAIPRYGTGTYNYENCMSSCHQEYALKYCNCSPYFFPNQDTYPSCDIHDLLCLVKNNDVFNYQLPASGHPHFEDGDVGMNCSCLLDCNRFIYSAEIYQQPLGLLKETDKPAHLKQVFFDIHFRHKSIIRYRTEVTFDWITLTVGIGGIAGLFLGCSLLSGFEFIYYVTIRWYLLWKSSRSASCASPVRHHGLTNRKVTPVAWAETAQMQAAIQSSHFTKPLKPVRY